LCCRNQLITSIDHEKKAAGTELDEFKGILSE